MEQAIADYQREIAEVKRTLCEKTLSEESLEHDNHKLKFYTGRISYMYHNCIL